MPGGVLPLVSGRGAVKAVAVFVMIEHIFKLAHHVVGRVSRHV